MLLLRVPDALRIYSIKLQALVATAAACMPFLLPLLDAFMHALVLCHVCACAASALLNAHHQLMSMRRCS